MPFYYLVAALLLLCYLLCRWILGSFFGRVLIGIRENEARVELLGYSAPAYKTAVFSISAAMAGLAGCLFANWAEIVTPGVTISAQLANRQPASAAIDAAIVKIAVLYSGAL